MWRDCTVMVLWDRRGATIGRRRCLVFRRRLAADGYRGRKYRSADHGWYSQQRGHALSPVCSIFRKFRPARSLTILRSRRSGWAVARRMQTMGEARRRRELRSGTTIPDDIKAAITGAVHSVRVAGLQGGYAFYQVLGWSVLKALGINATSVWGSMLYVPGYVDGRDVEILFRHFEGARYDRLPALAEESVRHQVTVIVASGGPASALAAKSATTRLKWPRPNPKSTGTNC
jgi:hypothetical protein